MKLSILVPVFNEEKTIISVLKRIHETKVSDTDYEIIVINDGSTDNTKKLLESNNDLYTSLINNIRNSGKGFSVKQGLKKANGEYVIFQDADLEYDPIEFKKFINVCNKFNADVILGSRFNYSDYTRSHNILNKEADMKDQAKNFRLFEETLTILKKAWKEKFFNHKGEFYTYPAPDYVLSLIHI